MAIGTPFEGRKTKKLKRSSRTKKQYDVYYKKMRRDKLQPMTFAHWKKSGRIPTYFKGMERTRAEAHLSRKHRKRLGMAD